MDAFDNPAEVAPGAPVGGAVNATAKHVQRFYAYFTYGLGDSDASDRRFPFVEDRLRKFLVQAASIMGSDLYPGGRVDLIEAVCAVDRMPPRFWYKEPPLSV